MSRHTFAPGVIETHQPERSALAVWLARIGLVMAASAAVITAAYFAGYYWG